MDIQIDNYNSAVANSEIAMVQDYYKSQPPFKGAPGYIPAVPVTEDGTPMVSAEACAFKYIELQLPDGTSRLAVLTPWTASNGPGPKFKATQV